MTGLTEKIGSHIRILRKKNGLTVQELAAAICKSKATVSKYENGQIAIDIVTLYDIATALNIEVEQLLYHEPIPVPAQVISQVPTFFKNLNQFFMYIYDGRNNSIIRSVIDVHFKLQDNIYKVMMYMNCKNLDSYQSCENTYTGTMTHYDALTNLRFQNRDTPMEEYTMNILASFLDAPYKWALNTGISSRPLMPIAVKALVTKKPAVESSSFRKALQVSKEDIRLLKLYNMLSITG